MRIVRRHRIRSDISSLVFFANVANNDISLLGTKGLKNVITRQEANVLALYPVLNQNGEGVPFTAAPRD